MVHSWSKNQRQFTAQTRANPSGGGRGFESRRSLRRRSVFDKIVRMRQPSPSLGPIWVW